MGRGSSCSDDAGIEALVFAAGGLAVGIFAFLEDLLPLRGGDSHSNSAGAIRAT